MDMRANVSDLTIRDELQAMDLKAAKVKAINATEQFRIVEFLTWHAPCQFKACRSSGEGRW